jgi:hypothetical protein
LDDLRKAISPGSLAALEMNDMRRRVARELGALFPGPQSPTEMVDGSVANNVREVYTYLTERKGKREMPLQ